MRMIWEKQSVVSTAGLRETCEGDQGSWASQKQMSLSQTTDPHLSGLSQVGYRYRQTLTFKKHLCFGQTEDNHS